MVCEHLKPLELAIKATGIEQTLRSKSIPGGEWVHFACRFDLAAVRQQFDFADCVVDEVNNHFLNGHNAGVRCAQCGCAITGIHPEAVSTAPIFRG